MARKFDEIRAEIDADPQMRARVDAEKQVLYASLRLADMRRAHKLTQKEMAAAMGVSQARVSQIEHGKNMELDTMSRYVAVLGGRLEVTVVDGDPAAR